MKIENDINHIKFELKLLRKELLNKKENDIVIKRNIKKGKERIVGLELLFNEDKLIKCNIDDLSVGMVCDIGDNEILVHSIFIGNDKNTSEYLKMFGGTDIILLK